MANILEQAIAKRELNNIRTALKSAGVDITDIKSLSDAAKAIEEQLVTGPNAVVNATLSGGPGIKILPIDKKGYRISATSDATISADLTRDLPSGTPVHKVLWAILHKIIPDSMNQAARAQSIVDIDFFRAPYDGKDYYVNRSFQKGDGIKSGLRPETWYLRIFTTAQKEPLYVDAGPMLEAVCSELEGRLYKRTDELVRHLFNDYELRHAPRPRRPDQRGPRPGSANAAAFNGFPPPPPHCCPPPPPRPFPWETEDPTEPEEPTDPTEPEEPVDPVEPEEPETPVDPSDCPSCDTPIVLEDKTYVNSGSETSTEIETESGQTGTVNVSISGDNIVFPWEKD